MKTKTDKNGGVATDTLEPPVRCQWGVRGSTNSDDGSCGKVATKRHTNRDCYLCDEHAEKYLSSALGLDSDIEEIPNVTHEPCGKRA